MKDQREVRRLSPWGDVALRLNPYPAHYRLAFACSLIPYPPSRRLLASLASRFPDRLPGWGVDGLTTFRRSHSVG
jgi:hypothetical protein